MRQISSVLILLVAVLLTQAPAEAATISKEFPFELGKWCDVESQDGPITIHRVRVDPRPRNIKSKVFRPSNSEFLETVQIQIEFSNAASRDIDLRVRIHWVDADGHVIDGHNGKEELGDEKSYGQTTITLSTLRYGLDQARKLVVDLAY